MLRDWHSWFGTFTGVVALTVVALPLVVVAVWLLARWRTATGATRAWAWRKSLAEVVMVYGTVPSVWLTLLPGGDDGRRRVSLVPLQDLISIVTDNPRGAVMQIIGNLLLFAAIGFFAPLRFTTLASAPRMLVLSASCSILIETAQYVLNLDRVSSVDDVLLNAAGAGLATLASRRWWRAVSHMPPIRSAA